MAIKPILFNTEMVKAILDGRKTQTRRIIKNQNIFPEQIQYSGKPYYPEDILWVRETWTEYGRNFYYRADFESDWLDPCNTISGGYPIYCRYYPECEGCTREMQRIHWHPSIHMPKEAARIFLRVTGVRAERLHDMTDRDAEKEGIGNLYLVDVGFGDKDYGCVSYVDSKGYIGLQVEQFAHLWDSTIKKDDLPSCGWEANPWVWVIGFERIENR